MLLTNSPRPKVVGLEAYGLEIAGTRRISWSRLMAGPTHHVLPLPAFDAPVQAC